MDLFNLSYFAAEVSRPAQTDPNRDRLWKIWPLVKHIQQQSRQARQPGNAVCIDEAMVSFLGWSMLPVYIINQPTPRGVKVGRVTSVASLLDGRGQVWMLAEARTHCTLNFEIYTGARTLVPWGGRKMSPSCTRTWVPDDWLPPTVASQAQPWQTPCWSSRRISSGPFDGSEERYPPISWTASAHSVGRSSTWGGHKCYTVWRDRKPVCFLPTGIPLYTEHTTRRWVKNSHGWERAEIQDPHAAFLSRDLMRAVDVVDQYAIRVRA